MEYIVTISAILIYCGIGVGFQALYWRYSDAELTSSWDKIWGNVWLMAWPFAFAIGVALLPFSLAADIPRKMYTRRESKKKGPPDDDQS